MGKAKKIIDRVKKDIRQYWVAGAAFVVYYLAVHAVFGAFCPFLVTAGFPCVGCGLTRAGLHLLRGNIVNAAASNPSIFAVILFLLYCGYFRYLRGEKIKGFSIALGALVTVSLTIYIYRMYLYFPDKAPYVYQRKNLLAETFPWYRRLMDHLLAYIRLARQ